MSIDKDSNDERDVSPVERPPAISERLWSLIPDVRRADYRKAAAFGLRRGIHPETTIIEKLEKERVCSSDVIERILGSSDARHEDESFLGHPTRPENRVQENAETKPDDAIRPTRPPLWPFGTKGYRRTSLPLGEIGSILHVECDFDGPTASEIEWLVLRAVSRDPVFVQRDVRNLKFLGCDLPPDVLSAVTKATLFECACVIDDVRKRQSQGDFSAMSWLDPETFVL